MSDENLFFKILESEFLKFERTKTQEIKSEWVNSSSLRTEEFFYSGKSRLACLLLREKKIALYYPTGTENCIGKIGFELSLKKAYNIKRKEIKLDDENHLEFIVFEYGNEKYLMSLINLVKSQKFDLWDNSSEKRFLKGIKVY